MRYLMKAALSGLLGGLLLAIVVIGIDMVYAQRTIAAQMASCVDDVCDGYAQVGGVRELLTAFVIGSAAGFAWFLWRQQRLA